jgi:hypothetical protein
MMQVGDGVGEKQLLGKLGKAQQAIPPSNQSAH